MKLQNLLSDALLNPSINSETTDLTGEMLNQIKDSLLKCEEFSDVDELIILDTPNLTIGTKNFTCSTLKIGSSTKFRKRAYVYGIYLSPICFNIASLSNTFKKGASILPTQYDPYSFEPFKTIILKYNPTDENCEVNTQKLLNDVIENPEKYEHTGERSIMIRGIFEEIEMPITKIDIFKTTLG